MIIEKKSLAASQTKDIHIYMEPGISVYAGAIAGAMFAGKYAIKKYPIMESTEFLIIG